MRKAAVTAFAAALVVSFLGASSGVSSGLSSGLSSAAYAAGPGQTEEQPCPVAVPEGTTCGFLLVPERRDVPNSRTIKVGYAVHRSTAAGRKQDPVVYSNGGPGSPSLQLIGLLSRMLPDRDVVVVEQRGGRYSEPRLACPEIVRGLVQTLQSPAQMATETAPIIREALTCQDRLQGEHIDLRGYQTAEIAADVVDLRKALGYPKWNLFGVSYSTRSMLQAASDDPAGTRSVVLDSFLPAKTKWYDEATPALGATIAKLGITARFDAMVARLNARPATLETRDPLTHKRITVNLTGDDVATILEEALHEADVIPIVPALVDGLADGRTGLLQPLIDQVGEGLTSHDWGLYYAVQCQDEVPFNSFRGGGRLRLFTGVADAAVCGAWNLPAARGESVAAISTQDTGNATGTGGTATGDGTAPAPLGRPTPAPPVLVVGGQFDPTTPPESAREAARGVPGARFTEFAGIGHAVFLSSECGRRTIAAFLDDPAATGAPCDPARAPYPIVRPGELALTSSAYKAINSPALFAPLALFVLVSAVQLLAGLAGLVRRRGGGPTALAGLAGLAFAGLSALSVYGMADETALAIGVPKALPWYGLLAVLATALSTVAAFRLRARAIQIVPSLAGLALLAWLYGWLLG